MSKENGDDAVPEELAALDAQMRGVERRVEHTVDPGPTGMVVSVCMLVLVGGFLLPWTGPTAGWQVLAGLASPLGPIPLLFAGVSLTFGLVCSGLALATRRFGLAWLAAVGCGVSVLIGVLAIWSRQIGVPFGETGPGIGLILSVLAMPVLAGSWVRIATRR